MYEISYSCQLEGDGCEKYQENVQEKVKSTEKKYLWRLQQELSTPWEEVS